MTKTFTLTANMWMYPGKAAWHFVTIPPHLSSEIDEFFAHAKRGWGSLRVHVRVRETEWTTSIFPDNKTHSYLLPIKSEVRKKEHLLADHPVALEIEISD
jgi:hypothetical protein